MSSANNELTPAMRQYMLAKQELPKDTILLFRMGDFYELFFDDAKIASPLMDVVLTSRASVPMCGVPYRAVKVYVAKLLEAGKKVAIAEQMEDPKLAKGIVKREISQIITPGTLLDDDLLTSSKSNFMVSLYFDKGHCGLAMLDLSTGDFRITELALGAQLEMELNRLNPNEIIVPASIMEQWQLHGNMPKELPRQITWTPLEDWHFDRELCQNMLLRHFQVSSLDGFGCRGYTLALSAAGAILFYAKNNLRQNATHITRLSSFQSDGCLVLDRISQRNLELVESIFADSKNNTLLSVMNETVTPMGSRLMREWLLRPLNQKSAIEARLDGVDELYRQPMLLAEMREILSSVRDLERTVSRLSVGNNASGRDLQVMERGLSELPELKSTLRGISSQFLCNCLDNLIEMPDLVKLLSSAIVDTPPVSVHDGGIIREGYNAELDVLRRASTEGKDWIAAYQMQEQQRTGIKNLKVRFNKVFGYYIEVSKVNLQMVPQDYIRKQTIVNGERFITPELKEIEDKVLGSDEKAKELEYQIFQELRGQVIARIGEIQQISHALAELDCIGALAEIAIRYNYIRPIISEEPILDIKDGRHPVLDARMENESFVPNDAYLDTNENQIALITGPNMAGKSTYIRQIALLVVMAQTGSFIPASSAIIGLTDRIFTRVGAADDLSRGQSTFMVEMVETANILNHATAKSLIILDEIGRGTSTFDGLSLAWAIAEFLHDVPDVKARTMFATHYHELTALTSTKPGVKNYNVLVREDGDTITFMRKIIPGSADKSYGIHVAKLAGIPQPVITRAKEVLTNLENNEFGDDNKPKLSEKRPRKKSSPEANDSQMFFNF